MRRMMSISSVLMLGGCIEGLLAEGAALAPDTEADGSSSTGAVLPTTSGPGVQTVTGVDGSSEPGTTSLETGTSTGEAANQPPTIELFAASPEHVSEAGAIELELVAHDDHVVVEVRLELDGEKLADLVPADFPYAYGVLSAKYNGNARTFKVVVRDAEGLEAEATDEVSITLPQPGAEKCVFEDPAKGTVTSVISALEYTAEGIRAVGSRDTGAGPRISAWTLDPDTCAPLPGWPKTLANWSADPSLAGKWSVGTAVDVDEDGNLVVAGDFLVGGKPQSYVALLNPDGARVWEKLGKIGDEVLGVGASTGQFGNRVFVVGSRRTSDNPVRTDGAVWVYQATDGKVFGEEPTLLRPPLAPGETELDELNELSEWARAVEIEPFSGTALVGGEREFKTDLNTPSRRAFALRIDPFGDPVGTPWTSSAPALPNDAVRAVRTCGDGLVAAGWTRAAEPDAAPQPILFWLDAGVHRHLPQATATELYGVACDREGKIVSAGTRTSGFDDARVFTVLGISDPPSWYELGVVGDDGAGAVSCDGRGFCAWGGYRTVSGKSYAVVRVHHP